MRKKEFIHAFAQKGYTKKDSAVIVDDFIDTISEILADGESIIFQGFGSFTVRDRKEREVYAIGKGGGKVLSPAYKAPVFCAGDTLKTAVKTGVYRPTERAAE